MRGFLRLDRPLVGGVWLFAIAGVAAVAAIAFALAPVDQQTYTYSFSPAQSGVSGEPGDPVIAPLPLLRSSADELEIRFGCEEGGKSQFRSMTTGNWAGAVLSVRVPGSDLQVRLGSEAVIAVGGHDILEAPMVAVPGCVVDVSYRDGTWRLSTGDTEVSAVGEPPTVAEALFVGPAAQSPATEIVVTTRELGSSPSPIQYVLLAVALVALAFCAREVLARGRPQVERVAGPARIERVDIAVMATLVGWLILLPAGLDDGWTAASQSGFSNLGDNSGIFSAGAAPMPFGYWLEWVRHWWLELGTVPVVMRIPSFLIGVGTWFGLRSIGRRLAVPGAGGSAWIMGGAFVVGFGAWGMTLRTEPAIAALVVGSLAMAFRFAAGGRGSTIVGWIAIVALGATAHPAGLMVAAPLVASWRSLRDWIRSSREALLVAATGLLMLGSATVILFFFDTNVSSKLEAIGEYQAAGFSQSVFDEFERYRLLTEAPYGATMRVLSVALLLFAIGAFVVRRRQSSDPANLPAWSLIVGLVLLTATPSKWPWHFGGLLGLAALAVAIESRRAAPGASGWSKESGRERWRGPITLLGTIGLVALAFSVSTQWNVFDLRSSGWWNGLELTNPLVALVLAVVAVGLIALGWRGVWAPVEGVVGASVILVLLLTASTLVTDIARTDGWTFGGDNLRALVGRSSCGLGDELMVPVPGSLVNLESSDAQSDSADLVAEAAGFDGSGAFATGDFPAHSVSSFRPDGINAVRPAVGLADVGSWVATGAAPEDENTGTYRSAWFRVDRASVAVMVMGSFGDESGNAVGVQWGSGSAAGVEESGIELSEAAGYRPDWSLVTFAVPDGADQVRVLLRDGSSGSDEAWVAASEPLGFETASLADVVANDPSGVLVSPPLTLYFPCIPPAGFSGPVVDPPGLIVQTWGDAWQSTSAAAVSTDRYFRWDVTVDPPLRSEQVGAHTGDVTNFVFVSQEYLTGSPARANSAFTQIAAGP